MALLFLCYCSHYSLKIGWDREIYPRTVKYTYNLIYVGYNTIYFVDHFDHAWFLDNMRLIAEVRICSSNKGNVSIIVDLHLMGNSNGMYQHKFIITWNKKAEMKS